MSPDARSFVSGASSLAKNPLGIIALFIVLVYGFNCLLFGVSSKDLTSSERMPVIWFVVLFPLVVLALFGWLVTKHHAKLYAPSDFKNEDSFLGTPKQEIVASNAKSDEVVKTTISDSSFELVSMQEKAILNDIQKQGHTDVDVIQQLLIRQLASQQVLMWFNQIYQIIYGAQIEILKLATDDAGVEESRAKRIFDETQKKFTALANISFEQYISYLFQSGFIETSSDRYKATTKGKEFIQILSISGYSQEKPN